MVYELIANQDYCGAILLLKLVEKKNIIDQYNLCFCLYHTSKVEETIPILKQLVGEVTDLVEMKKMNLEDIHLELIAQMNQPVPLTKELLPFPCYVMIQVKWLYALALIKVNLLDQATIMAKSLEKYKVKI